MLYYNCSEGRKQQRNESTAEQGEGNPLALALVRKLNIDTHRCSRKRADEKCVSPKFSLLTI